MGKALGKYTIIGTVPIILLSWTSDVQAKGPVAGTLNTVLDTIPVVGEIKLGVEFFWGDWIPDRGDPDSEPCPESDFGLRVMPAFYTLA